MLVLDATNRTIEVDLLEAHTTTPLRAFAMWRDITTTGYTPGSTPVDTNGTTDVVLVAAPAASTQRVIDYLSVFNSDTAAKTVIIRYVDNTTERTLIQVVLGIGEVLQYIDGQGWQVLTINGSQKMAISQGTNAVSSGLNAVSLNANVVNNNATLNTIADVTGLSFPVTAGQRYWFRFTIPYSAAATTTGSRWSINGPTFTSLNFTSKYTLTATTETTNYATAYDIPAASNASSLTVGNVAVIEGMILPSADGNVIARFASEIANSAITALRGAVVQYMAVG